MSKGERALGARPWLCVGNSRPCMEGGEVSHDGQRVGRNEFHIERAVAVDKAFTSNAATDDTLDAIAERTREITADVVALYDKIRAAKGKEYSYNELEAATGFPRGTLQNIIAGKNPRLSVW